MLRAWSCCTAAPAADAFTSSAGTKHVADTAYHDTLSKQQQSAVSCQLSSSYVASRQQHKQSAAATSRAPKSTGIPNLWRRQHANSTNLAQQAAAAPDATISPRSCSCSAPLTSSSLIAAANGCHSLSASISVQAYQRNSGPIRHQTTGDSPSEIHSELIHQQQHAKVVSCYDTTRDCSGIAGAGSVRSALSLDEQQLQHNEQQQQHSLQLEQLQSRKSSLSSALLQEFQQQFSGSNSCHATASSASMDDHQDVLPTAAAVAVKAASSAAVEELARATIQQDKLDIAPHGASDAVPQTPPQQQKLEHDPTSVATVNSSSDSNTLPPNLHLIKHTSGHSFVMTDPQLSSSSDNTAAPAMPPTQIHSDAAPELNATSGNNMRCKSVTAAPAGPLPAIVAAPAGSSTPAAGRVGGAGVKHSRSPFAQLSLQQNVATTLMSRQQRQQQQEQSLSLPLMQLISSGSLKSAPSSATATAAAAARRHTGSSSSASTANVAHLAAATSPLTQDHITTRSTRVSWAASSSTKPLTASAAGAAEPPAAVFDVLDPQACSVTSELRILKHSASTSSLCSTSSSRGVVSKLQQLRAAVSMSVDLRDSSSTTAAAAGLESSSSSGKRGLMSILRRSTDSFTTSASVKSSTINFRRSKSAHTTVLQNQNSVAATDMASEADPSAALRASTSSIELRKSLPPLPPAALGSASSSGLVGAGSSGVARTFTSAAVAGSFAGSCSSSSNGSNLTAAAAGSTGLLQHSASSGRLAHNAQRLATLDSKLGSSTNSLQSMASNGPGTGGANASLVALAVNRMHSTFQTSSSTTSSSTTGQGGATGLRTASSGSTSASSAAAGSTSRTAVVPGSDSVRIATAFAEAFLAALATGNTKWGSDPAVANLLHETAKMMGMDKQLYCGKMAIIRRLNSGMDQLVKMVAANAPESSATADGAAGTSTTGSTAVADLANSMPKPVLSVTCPDPKAKPTFAVAVYTFKWGIRKFSIKDEFIVKQGQIMRLRRSRN